MFPTSYPEIKMLRRAFLLLCTASLATSSVAQEDSVQQSPPSIAANDAAMRSARAENPPPPVATLIQDSCLDCHNSLTQEGGLDLETLPFDLGREFAAWVQIHDRVAAGEMPPADYGSLSADQAQQFTAPLAESLQVTNLAKHASEGRVQYRRLNRDEYGNTLRDLLGLPGLEVADMLPADSRAHGFDNVGAALDLSYVQMSRYLEAANAAIDEAMIFGPRPETEVVRLEAMTNGRLSQVVKKEREAVAIDNFVGLLRQPNSAQAPWWWAKFPPPIEARYRLRMKAFGFYWDQGEVRPAKQTHVVTFQTRYGSTLRKLDSFDVPSTQQDAAILDCTVLLKPGEQLQVHLETLDDRNKPGDMPIAEYSAPGVAFEWLEIEGPLIEQWHRT